jgi:hypothetical protein
MPLKLRAVKKRSSSMANEGNAQGIDDLLDEVPEETTAEETPEQVETPVETPAEETPAEETTETAAEVVEETESQVAKLFDEKDHLKEMAPVSEVVKQRKLKQEAIAKAEALKSELEKSRDIGSQTLEELTGLLQGEDDEYIEKKDLKKVVENLPKAIAVIAAETANQALANEKTNTLMSKAKSDEAVFKKDHADYDTIVGYVSQRKLLTTDQLAEIFASDNVAEAYYKKASEVLEAERKALGITRQPTTEEKPPTGNETPVNDDEPLDDEAGFEMFMSGDQSS